MSDFYPEEFKKSAVDKVLRFGKKESEVAKELSIPVRSLNEWVHMEKNNQQSSKNLYIAKLLERKIQELSEDKNALVCVLKILIKELNNK